MKAVFMGTPEIAAVILKEIAATDTEILAVVTQPDKPKGRGQEMAFSEVKKAALELGIRVLQPVRAKEEEFIEEICRMNPDIILVAAFGQILTKALRDIPKYGCINVHASLLPRYRGASPIQWAVMNGDEKTGITIMHMEAGIDTGDMILKKEILIDEKETGGSLHDKLAVLGAEALKEALVQIEAGTAERIPQDDSEAIYVTVLKKSDGLMDFNKPAEALERMVRGLNPWPSAYTFYKGRMLKVWSCEVILEDNSNKSYKQAEAGTIVRSDKENIYIKTGSGLLKLCEVQLEGKKRMSCEEFLRGNLAEEGDLLGR